MNRIRNIRIYVRNKQKYNPATFSNNLQYVDIADFAGTTIGSIKEECRKNNAARIDDLYFNNEPLADDRSVAHYNLENGTILETTSNPLWVACMNIKIVEVERERDAHPHDKGVQKWTEKSYIRKRTILSVLLNSKSEFPRQPPNLPTVESLVEYLKTLGKKGTEMNPFYTQKDLQQFYNEYLTFDLDQADPIGSFLTRQAARLGFDGTGPLSAPRNTVKKATPRKVVATRNPKPSTTPRSRKKSEKQEVMCEDCESSRADMYCPDCRGAAEKQGVCLCTTCADKLHQGALKRDHNVRDIVAAPQAPKQYVPHPYRSPFAILIGMYRGLMETPPVLSMSEDDIKFRAQPFTDTDLQDKQTGRYVGGFDCLENTLMKKGFVQKEAAGRHTFSLTTAGQELGEQLYLFHEAVTIFRSANQVPDLPASPTSFQCGTRRLYLVIDDKERDLTRFCNLAKAHGIRTLVRSLPAGDYLWVLSPPLASPTAEYDGNNRAAELVLPFVVERKSWNDYYNTWRTSRFQRQIDNMKASGVRNCFYLVEGSVKNLRFVSTGQQERLKEQLEVLLCEERFYVNYTSSWSKSAQWCFWMTFLITAAYKQGLFTDCRLTYPDLQRNISRRLSHREIQRPGQTHVWLGQDMVAAMLSDGRKEQAFSMTCDNNFGSIKPSHSTPQLLVIEGLEAYNKQRSSLLNKSLESVVNTSEQELSDGVARLLKPEVESLLHYDVFSYWQLYIQVNYGVHVVRTELAADTTRVQADFVAQQSAIQGHEMVLMAKPGRSDESHKAESSSKRIGTDRPELELLNLTQGLIGGGRAPGLSVRVPETPASEMFPANISQDDEREDGTKSGGPDGPDGPPGGVPETDFAPDSQTEDDMIKMAIEQSRRELESTAATIRSDSSHTGSIRQVNSAVPSTISGGNHHNSLISETPNRSYQFCVRQSLPIQPEVISLDNSQELVTAEFNSLPSTKPEIISVEDSQDDCKKAIVISLEDSQGDDYQTEPCGQFAGGPYGISTDCLQSSGASVDDPLVLEDSQEIDDLPHNDQVITLADSQEGSPQSQHQANKMEAWNLVEMKNEFQSQEQTMKTFSEGQSQGQSLVKVESNSSANLMDMLTEEEQLKLALNQSLCESSCPNYDPMFDHDDEVSSIPKTPTKRKHQNDYFPTAKVPRMTPISEIASNSNDVARFAKIPLEKTDSCVKPNACTSDPPPFQQLEQLSEINKSTKTKLINNSCAKQISQTDSIDLVPKEPSSETDSLSNLERLTDAEIARQMQEEFDREHEASLSQSLSHSQPTSLRSKRKTDSIETHLDSSPSQKEAKKNVKTENSLNQNCVIGKVENSSEMNSNKSFMVNKISRHKQLSPNDRTESDYSARISPTSETSVYKCVSQVDQSLVVDVKTEGGPAVASGRQSLCVLDAANEPLTTRSESEGSQSVLGFVDKKLLGCISVKQEGLSTSEPVDDEELARQLQEQFDKEAKDNRSSSTLEPKSLRKRTFQKDSGVKSPTVQKSGVQVKSEVWNVREDQPQENISLGENNEFLLSQDSKFAQRVQIEGSRNDSLGNHSVTNDEELAKKLHMEETRRTLKGNQMTLADEEYAKRVQLEEKERSLFQNQNTKQTKAVPNAQRIQLEDKHKSQSLAQDEELARKIQLQEDKYQPDTNPKDYLSQDEALARRMQNEDGRPQPDLELVNQDEEYAKRLQQEEDMLGKSDDGGGDGPKKIRGQREDWKQDLTGTRKKPMFNRAEVQIADQLSIYRESQKNKFADRTSTQMHNDSKWPKKISSMTSPCFDSYTPPRPLTSHHPRVTSATVTSPCQRPQGSRTPAQPCVVPVGKVVPFSTHTSSTFKGLGNKTSNENVCGELKVNVKEEQKIQTIDITDNDETKAGVEECGASTSLVVKTMRCGNCKQLGHPRTYSQCPNFYTQAEVQRREAKAKENLKRREEKAKESEETLALLSNSERILKERKQAMLSQLQAEAEKVEEEFTHQIEALSRVVKKREKRGRKK